MEGKWKVNGRERESEGKGKSRRKWGGKGKLRERKARDMGMEVMGKWVG
jgi:hypothetical protein